MPDLFPQPLKYEQQLPNATDNLGNEIRFPLVLPRRETESTRIVTEIVSIRYDLGGSQIKLYTEAKANTGAASSVSVSLSYRALTQAENQESVGTATIGDIAVLDRFHFGYTSVDDGTPANNETAAYCDPIDHYITGGTGHGLIIPGDRLFVNTSTNRDLSGNILGIVIYYRQHLVGLNEYLGILAGFQQNPS